MLLGTHRPSLPLERCGKKVRCIKVRTTLLRADQRKKTEVDVFGEVITSYYLFEIFIDRVLLAILLNEAIRQQLLGPLDPYSLVPFLVS
jgi:hypothetical protein